MTDDEAIIGALNDTIAGLEDERDHWQVRAEEAEEVASESKADNNRRAGILLHIMHVLGDAPTRTEEGLPDAVAELVAERDRLREEARLATAAADAAAEAVGAMATKMSALIAERNRLGSEVTEVGMIAGDDGDVAEVPYLERRLAVVSDLWDEMAKLSMSRAGLEAPLHIMGDAEDVVAFRAAARRISVVLRELNEGVTDEP